MRIHGEKEAFSDAIQPVLRVVSPRATLPVLGGVRVESAKDGVRFSSSDLEVFMTVGAKDVACDQEGAVVVPGRLLGEILRSLPAGNVTVAEANGEVTVTGGTSEFSVTPLSAVDFPEAPKLEGAAECVVEAKGLERALQRVVRAASADEGRPILTGVLWSVEGGSLKLAATDSYRLAVGELGVKEESSEATAIIPARALGEVARQLQGVEGLCSVALGGAQAHFGVGDFSLTTRLIEGEFPNYRQLIPEGYQNRLSVSTDELASAVERVGLVAQTHTPLKLHLAEEVELTATEAGVAEATDRLDGATYEGEAMIIAFNPKFLRDGIEAASADRTTLEFGDPAKPAVIRGEADEGFLYLLMPVRPPG